MNDEILYKYNDECLLSVSDSGIYFLTVLRLEQFQNVEDAEQNEIDKNESQKNKLFKSLGYFDFGSLLKKANYGASYKIVSYYKRLSALQKYILEYGVNEDIKDILINGYKEEPDFLDFKKIKDIELTKEAINKDFYIKEDYVVIKTDIPKYNIIENKKENKKSLKDIFMIKDIESYLKIKDRIDILFAEHFKNYELLREYSDDSYKPTGNDMLNTLVKLSLTKQKTFINDLSVFNNNLFVESNRGHAVKIKCYKNEYDKTPSVLKFDTGYVAVSEYGKKTKYELIPKNEEWDYSFDKKQKELKIYRIISGSRFLFKSLRCEKIEEEIDKSYITSFTLAEIPTDFNINISQYTATVLKNLNIEEFSIFTEIIKTSKDLLDKTLEKQRQAFKSLVPLKTASLNGYLFSPELALKKATAMESMRQLMDNGSDYANIRMGISIKTDYINDNLEKMINSKLGGDIIFAKIPEEIKELNYPFTFTNFLKIKEKQLTLQDSEILKMFDLDYGERFFSGRNEKNSLELYKINQKHIYVERKEQLQSINLFDGPEAFNVLVIAASGGGKSFLTVNILDNFLDLDENNLVWIVDRGGSYNNFTTINNGNNISIKPSNSKNCINPFIFNNYFSKIVKVLFLLSKRSEDSLSDNEEKELLNLGKSSFNTNSVAKDMVVIDKDRVVSANFDLTEPQAILEIFFNVVHEMLKTSEMSMAEKNRIPISYIITKLISDKYDEANNDEHYYYLTPELIKTELLKEIEKRENDNVKENLQSPENLLQKMDMFINQFEYGNLFNGEPTLDLEKRLVNVDFGEIQNEDIQNLVLTSLLSTFFNVMTSSAHSKGKKILVIDEAHAVLNAKSSLGLASVSYLFRTARKHGALVYLISQGIKDFSKLPGEVDPLKMAMFSGIIGNAGWTFLLKKHNEIECKERLSLPPKLAKYVDQNNSFKFLIKSKITGKASLIMSDLNYAVATTNKDEKNMLSILDNFIIDNNPKKKLVLFALLFKKNFIGEYQDVLGFCSNLMASSNLPALRDKFEYIFKIYNNKNINDTKYINYISSKIKDDALKVKVINGILMLVSKKNIEKEFLDIIFKKMV